MHHSSQQNIACLTNDTGVILSNNPTHNDQMLHFPLSNNLQPSMGFPYLNIPSSEVDVSRPEITSESDDVRHLDCIVM